MAYGRPCLASSFVASAFGSQLTDAKAILVAKNAEEFCEKTLAALRTQGEHSTCRRCRLFRSLPILYAFAVQVMRCRLCSHRHHKPSPSPMTTQANPKRTLILGAAWTVGTRWAIKGIGFLNTVIMARLVLPADYGIVAMAMLVVGLTQALMDFGASTALMRKRDVSRDEIDSAWTLRWLQNIGMGLILLLISPFAATYFEEPRVEYVLWVLAACVAVAGAGNIGLVLAQKEFNFSLEFRIQVICKTLGVVATVAAGYLLRDYRALVIGVCTGYISGLVLSYGDAPLSTPLEHQQNRRHMGCDQVAHAGRSRWVHLAKKR